MALKLSSQKNPKSFSKEPKKFPKHDREPFLVQKQTLLIFQISLNFFEGSIKNVSPERPKKVLENLRECIMVFHGTFKGSPGRMIKRFFFFLNFFRVYMT